MNWLTLGLFGLSGLLWVPQASIAGDLCSESCVDPTRCTFSGLENVATGDAQLSLDSTCNLVVGGVGASGIDGVVQQGLASFVMATELGTPNFSLSATGAQAAIRQVGVAGGVSGREIMLTTLTNFNDDDLRLVVSCAEIGVQSYLVRVFDGRTLVGQRVLGVDPPLMRFPKGDLERVECGIWTNGDVYSEIRLGGSVPFTFDNPGVDPGPLTGDRLFVAALSPAEEPTLQESIENVFVNTGPVTISSFFVSAPPSCDPVCATVDGTHKFKVKGEKRQKADLILDLALDQGAGTWSSSDSQGDTLSGLMTPVGSSGRKFDLELGPEANADLGNALSVQASQGTGGAEMLQIGEKTKIRAKIDKKGRVKFQAKIPADGSTRAKYSVKAKGVASP